MASSASTELIKFETKDRKCYLTFNRPEALNAMTPALYEELRDAMTRFNEDDDLLVAILAGEGGRAFSVGADLKELSNRSQAGANSKSKTVGPKVARRGKMMGFDDVEQSTKPIIAAIDGYCLAGGFEIALYCDIRVATAKSTFGLPEPKRSLLAGPGLIHLSRMIPLGEALRMQLTGTSITAARAYELGLISQVVETRDELISAADGIANEILACAPLAVQYIKRIVKEGRDMELDAQWRFSEMFSRSIYGTEDFLEGPRSFAEKREPVWRMR